jgi:hypothetical protein
MSTKLFCACFSGLPSQTLFRRRSRSSLVTF